MIRKLFSFIVVGLFLIISALPVHCTEMEAVNRSNQIIERSIIIDELIFQAAAAARSGDLNTALKYEEIIKSYGVEVITTNDTQAALSHFGMVGEAMGITADDDIPYPEDDNSVRWYKSTTVGFYQWVLGGYYDIIKLTAVSWDDTSEWLHAEMASITNPKKISFSESLFQNASSALLNIGIEQLVPGVSAIYTVADIADQMKMDLSDYHSFEIDSNCITCVVSADMTVNFWYARSNGSGRGYGLYYAENMIEANYMLSGVIRYANPNGKVDSLTFSKGGNKTFKDYDFGNMSKVCYAYANDRFEYFELGKMYIEYDGGSIPIGKMVLPVDPWQLD